MVTYTIPRPGMLPLDTVLLGGTYQRENWDISIDTNIARCIFERCAKLEPSFNNAKILNHRVGLRPAREGGARVETEVIQFPLRGVLVPWNQSLSEESYTMRVVHAYGFG